MLMLIFSFSIFDQWLEIDALLGCKLGVEVFHFTRATTPVGAYMRSLSIYHCEIVRCSAVLAPLLRDRTSWRDAKHAIMRFHYYAAGMRHFSVRTRTAYVDRWSVRWCFLSHIHRLAWCVKFSVWINNRNNEINIARQNTIIDKHN